MTLLLDLLAGMLFGICYDLFRAFRKNLRTPAASIFLDLLFWMIVLFGCIWLFLLTGDRKFRYYELFGAISGFWCYFLTFSAYFVKILEKIADYFLFFLKMLFTSITFFGIIVKNGVLFLCKPLGFVIRFGKKAFTNGVKKYKQNRKLMKRI